jgi:putative FmdB family regulatory protein
MPTYDYRCQSCSHTWEEWQSITAPPTKTCPECGKPKAERVIGPGAGLLFKGSGFYITDYRSDSYKKAAKSDAGANGSAKGDSKSPSKSEAKSGTSSAPA